MLSLKLLAVTSFLSLSALASSESSPLFNCKFISDNSEYSLILDAVGQSQFKISDKDSCKVTLTHMSGGRLRHIPGYKIVWTVGECQGSLKEKSKILNRRITLDITPYTNIPAGLLTWRNDRDPQNCVLEHFREEDLSADLEKWKKDSWGPKPK